MNALVKAASATSPATSVRLSDDSRTRAVARLGADIRPVAWNEQLIDVASCERIIATMDADLQPCTRDEATTLVALLMTSYPGATTAMSDRDRAQYFSRLFEAFSQFSAAVGRVIVHGGQGVPAKQRFRPQPSDIVAFGTAEVARIQNTKTMAQRHIAERRRRDEERAKDRQFAAEWGTPDERKAKADRILARFRESVRVA